ncbi:glycosyltransferase family 2 protein [Sinomicrobium sp. M5D2P17]
MKPNKIKISIIVPHYNVPALLQRCIDSIPQRDDLEVIIVDDKSSAELVDFDNFPGKNRDNVRVFFQKENKGGGAARNVGLENAKGEWLLFADSDDFFHSCLNDVIEEYKDSDADLIFFNANSVDTDTLRPTKNRAQHLQNFIDLYRNEPEKGLLQLKYLFGEPWAKMVKREIIVQNHIRFDETIIHNDTTFSYCVGYYSDNIIVDDRTVYCITVRLGSVSTARISEAKIKTRVSVFARANKFFLDRQIPAQWNILYRQMAWLKLNDKRLYKECLEICESEGMSIQKVKKETYKEVPKVIAKKILGKK